MDPQTKPRPKPKKKKSSRKVQQRKIQTTGKLYKGQKCNPFSSKCMTNCSCKKENGWTLTFTCQNKEGRICPAEPPKSAMATMFGDDYVFNDWNHASVDNINYEQPIQVVQGPYLDGDGFMTGQTLTTLLAVEAGVMMMFVTAIIGLIFCACIGFAVYAYNRANKQRKTQRLAIPPPSDSV